MCFCTDDKHMRHQCIIGNPCLHQDVGTTEEPCATCYTTTPTDGTNCKWEPAIAKATAKGK